MLALTILAICLATSGGCAEVEGCAEDTCEEDAVGAFGTTEGGISSSAILSINGTYGAGCVLHPGESWSISMIDGAPRDYPMLEVTKKNIACTLALVSLRTGSTASDLYTATSPIALGAAYASSALFSSPAGSLSANAKLSALDFVSTFALTVLVSADVQTSGAGRTTYYAYDSRVLADAPQSYWRLDDTSPTTLASDDFAGSAGTALQSRTGATVGWTKHSVSGTNAVLSSAGRVRAGANKKGVYLASVTPSAADYAVSADVYISSLLSNDQAGVLGRASAASETYYFAGLVQSVVIFQFRRFELWKYVNGVGVLLGSYDDTPTAGTTRRVSLELVGSSIRASLDGIERIVVTDTAITSAGSSGLLVGFHNGSTQSDSVGLHLDNLSVRQSATLRDTLNNNHGLFVHGVARGALGALTVANASASFDGVDDYVEIARKIGDDFSIELWFRSTQGRGAASVTQWHQTAGLIDAGLSLSNRDFGIGLRSDGRVLAGTGKTSCVLILVCGDDDQTIVSSGTEAYNDGAWHHVVFTRHKTSGSMTLYVDGVSKGALSSGGSTDTLDAAANLNLGRLQSGPVPGLGSGYFAGNIDEVAVYTTVLGAQSVLNHFRAGRH